MSTSTGEGAKEIEPKREIKFRGLSLNGCWYYGLLSHSLGTKFHHVEEGWYISNSVGMPWAYRVRPETVGQYTNLKDRTGNCVYEGDIIDCGNRLYEVTISFNGYQMQRYKLWRGKFVPAHQYSMSVITLPSKKRFGGEVTNGDVIGNIYQNADLLNKLKD